MAHPLMHVLAPESIAIVGASTNPMNLTGKFIPNLQRHGYAGEIYPVHPTAESLGGCKVYRSLRDIDGRVDQVIIAVNASKVEGTIEECAAVGARSAVIVTSGFAELGPSGAELQDRIVRRANEAGIRVVGPNCMGNANIAHRVVASSGAIFAREDLPRGRLAVVSQSGGLGGAAVQFRAYAEGIGFSHLVNTGNEADLTIADFMELFVEDDATRVIIVIAEQIRDCAHFARAAAAARRSGKPVLIMKIGRSQAGQRMAASHTGALTGADAINDAAFRELGVIRVTDYEELYRTASLLDRAPLPTGEGLASVSISGGNLTLFADLAGVEDLKFPELSPQTKERLSKLLASYVAPNNPLDLGTAVVGDPTLFARTLEVLLQDDGVSIGVPLITVASNYDPVLDQLKEIAAAQEKPVIVLWHGGSYQGEGLFRLCESRVAAFQTPTGCVQGIRHLLEHARMRGREARELPFAATRDRARTTAGRRALSEHESKAYLSGTGLSFPREVLAANPEEARRAGASIGYPLVMKLQSAKIPHKSDHGLVALGIDGPAALERAWDDLMRKAAPLAEARDIEGILLAEQLEGAEFLVGMTRDPQWGPVVTLGAGGILVELLADVAYGFPPLDVSDAKRMLDSLRARKLLQGIRGRPVLDEQALMRCAQRVGDLAVARPDLLELDLNPVIVTPDRAVVADALVVLAERIE